jgi:hypothetical protein
MTNHLYYGDNLQILREPSIARQKSPHHSGCGQSMSTFEMKNFVIIYVLLFSSSAFADWSVHQGLKPSQCRQERWAL